MGYKPSKNGHYYKNTVEITFNGVKKRVSKEVADSLKKSGRGKKQKNSKK